MKREYDYYITDESFDYGDGWGLTRHCEIPHGFSIDISADNVPDISTIEGYGDYEDMSAITTLEELRAYIIAHIDEAYDCRETKYTNRACLEELVLFIEDAIKKAA